MNLELVIWGASGHALVVAETVRLQGKYHIAGFLDNVNPKRQGTMFCGALILGGQDQLNVLKRKGIRHLIFGFGDCEARLRLAGLVRAKGFSLAIARHPQAVISADVQIGTGSFVAPGVVVNPGTRIGENVILNTSASVDHECIIENGVHIAPGVRLGGKVTVGEAAWVGIGATVKDRIHIGKRSIIGAGAVVVDDIPDAVVAYGVPAKAIRRIGSNDR